MSNSKYTAENTNSRLAVYWLMELSCLEEILTLVHMIHPYLLIGTHSSFVYKKTQVEGQ